MRSQIASSSPFVSVVEPGHVQPLTEREAAVLRDYLLNGGFLMVDDFWGDEEWDGFYQAFRMGLSGSGTGGAPRSPTRFFIASSI